MGNLLHVSSYQESNITHTEGWTHSWLNNAQNAAFLFWSYFDYIMLVCGKYTRLSTRYTYPESLGTRLNGMQSHGGTCATFTSWQKRPTCFSTTPYITWSTTIRLFPWQPELFPTRLPVIVTRHKYVPGLYTVSIIWLNEIKSTTTTQLWPHKHISKWVKNELTWRRCAPHQLTKETKSIN